MQDNPAIRTSNHLMDWFLEAEMDVMDWQARSTDLNPIENLWGILARGVYCSGLQFVNTAMLKKVLLETWEKFHNRKSTPPVVHTESHGSN